MFTGLIQTLGTIQSIQPQQTGVRWRIAAELDRMAILGESIAHNGACLTVVSAKRGAYEVELSPETLEVTTLGELHQGDRVNIELPLTLNQPLGGHLVTGHVDGVGRLETVENIGDFWRLWVEAPAEVSRYCIDKGSICLEGISLTVNRVDGHRLELMIIPHTWEATNLHLKRVGSRVNLEADLLAKYVEKFLNTGMIDRLSDRRGGALTWERLNRSGFGNPEGDPSGN